ncbi:MAG: hypothetical protein JXN65_10760 [Clostridia bacterium]|nr:hypothetical protein [Clostridia bacterium]
MLKLKGKLLLTLLFGAVVSTLITGTAFAGVSISGNSQVYAGSSYTYTITVSENASSIMGTASTGGVLGSHSATWSKDSSSGLNSSLTATATITVSIPSSAAVGSTGTITVSGQGSSFDPNTSTVSKFTISGSKTVTVIAPPEPTPTPVPTPTPPPTPWELAIREIKRVENGGSITVEMDPESEREINVPAEAFKTIQDMSVILTIDYGSFKCVLDGSKVGVVPENMDDVNMGITLIPAERPDDMLVFTVNNTSQFFYIVDYLIEPFVAPKGDLIYVYREYKNISLLEYVNSADTDGNGNISVKVFAPGNYIVSAESIVGSEGNMDVEALIEMFATPTPEPTPTPTLTPPPTPTPTSAQIETEREVNYSALLLATVLLVLIAVLVTLIIIKKKRNSVN